MDFIDLAHELAAKGFRPAGSRHAIYLPTEPSWTWVMPLFSGQVEVRRGIRSVFVGTAEEVARWVATKHTT